MNAVAQKTMTDEQKDAMSLRVRLADIEMAGYRICGSILPDDPNAGKWHLTITDHAPDPNMTESERTGSLFISDEMLGWLMAVMFGGDECNITNEMYSKLEMIITDAACPRLIP